MVDDRFALPWLDQLIPISSLHNFGIVLDTSWRDEFPSGAADPRPAPMKSAVFTPVGDVVDEKLWEVP